MKICRPGQRGSGRRRPEAHRPVHGAHGPQRREEPQPVRHARHRGGHADQGGRRRRGRRGRRRDDGPRDRGARAAQGRLARRRPLGPPDRRRARRAPTSPPRATRWPRCSRRESPDLVLLGQQSDDGECYTIGAVVAEHLGMPSLTQVIAMEVAADGVKCERQAEYGYDTVQVDFPAVISVGDAINEPRYPSLKAIMGAKKKPLDTKADRRRRHRRRPGRRGRLEGRLRRLQGPAAEGRRRDHRGRGHQRDGREDRQLARREEADLDGRAS